MLFAAAFVGGFLIWQRGAGPSRQVHAPFASRQVHGPFTATLNSSLYRLQVDINPARSGQNELYLYAYTSAGSPLKVTEWRASVAQPAGGTAPIDVPLLPLTDSHAVGVVNLPGAGAWTFSFTLRTSDADGGTVSVTVSVV
jgi:copper transport protein